MKSIKDALLSTPEGKQMKVREFESAPVEDIKKDPSKDTFKLSDDTPMNIEAPTPLEFYLSQED